MADGYRDDAHCNVGFNMVILDIDDGESTVELATAMLKNYQFVLYTTKRHTDASHRFRIILPLKYHIKLNKEDYSRFMKNIYEWIPFNVDKATSDRARKWLTNSGQLYKNEGILLDPTNFIPNTQKANETKRNIDDLSNMDSIERFFLMQLNDGSSRNNTIIKLGLMLVDSGYNYESIEDKLISFNEKMDEPLPVKEVMSTVMQTVRKKIAERDS